VLLIFVTFGLSWHCTNLTRVTIRMTRGSPYSDMAQWNVDTWLYKLKLGIRQADMAVKTDTWQYGRLTWQCRLTHGSTAG
jgi:hypothetical protein